MRRRPRRPRRRARRVQALISRDKDNNCTKCHGANFNKPNDGTVPKLAGQNADYLFVALKAYKADKQPLVGRSNARHGRAGQEVLAMPN